MTWPEALVKISWYAGMVAILWIFVKHWKDEEK